MLVLDVPGSGTPAFPDPVRMHLIDFPLLLIHCYAGCCSGASEHLRRFLALSPLYQG